MERWPGLAWGATGIGVATALAIATVALPPAADAVALTAAALAAAGGIGAAWRRRRLARLPLALAPVAAVDERGPTVTFRAWLGRGRRVDQLTVTVRLHTDAGTVELPALVPPAPVVGRFQVVVEQLPPGWEHGRFQVRVEARDRAGTWQIERAYAPGDRRAGAFAAGIVRRGARIDWAHTEWSEVRDLGP